MDGSSGVKSFFGHLEELRGRLLFSACFFLLLSVFSYPLSGILLEKVKTSLLPGMQLVVLSPLEAVSVKLKVSFIIGFVVSLPIWLIQLWRFLGPGLSAGEKKVLVHSLFPSAALFLAGVSFSYLVLLPLTLGFMVREAYPMAVPFFSLDETMSFVLFMLLATGLSFQLPVVVYALSKAGLVDYRMMSSMRRHVVVGIFIAAAVVTPDPTFVSQLLIAVPMVLLYEVGVQISRFTR
jgi:sec-independent protein translocase protein TatC